MSDTGSRAGGQSLDVDQAPAARPRSTVV